MFFSIILSLCMNTCGIFGVAAFFVFCLLLRFLHLTNISSLILWIYNWDDFNWMIECNVDDFNRSAGQIRVSNEYPDFILSMKSSYDILMMLGTNLLDPITSYHIVEISFDSCSLQTLICMFEDKPLKHCNHGNTVTMETL